MERREISRRAFLRFSALTAAAAVVAGCTPAKPAEPTTAPKEKPTQAPEATAVPAATAAPAGKGAVEIVYWINWGGDAANVIGSLGTTEEFKSANPDVTVTVVPSKTMEAVLTAVASGEGPDAVSNYPYFEIYARGAALPITDWVNSSTIVKKEDIFEANWKGATYKGEIYGVPAIECFVRHGLCANVAMLEKEGLDPAKPPTTWEEMLEFHKKLTKFDDAGNLKQLGFDPYDAMGGSFGYGDPWIIPYSWGFSYYDADNQKFNINNPDMIEAWKIFTEFYDVVGAEKMAGFRQSYGTWTDPTGSFVVGTQAYQINGYWTPGELTHSVPDKKFAYSWTLVPEKRKGKKVQVAGGHYVCILKIAKHPQEMFKFGEFCNTEKGAQMIYDGLGWLSARKSFLEKVDTSKYPGLDWFVKSALENDEFGGITVNPVESFCSDTWTQLREQVYFHKMTVEEAVAKFQDDATKALEDMLKGG